MNRKRLWMLLCLSVLLVLLTGCSQKESDGVDPSESETGEEKTSKYEESVSKPNEMQSGSEEEINSEAEAQNNSEAEAESSPGQEITEMFFLVGLPPYANDLLNLWRKPDNEVFDHINNPEWNIEPIEGNQTTYYVNGTPPGDPIRVVSDGTIDYLGGKWGLQLVFGGEHADPQHSTVWGLGFMQYETVAESAQEAVTLMNAILTQFQENLGESMPIGMNSTDGPSSNSNYLAYEDKEETVESLPRGKTLFVVWDITPEDATEGVYYRLLVLLSPYYNEKGTEQLGYSLRIRFYNTQFKDWL